MRRIGRLWLLIATIVIAGVMALSGCHLRIYDGGYYTDGDDDAPGSVVEDEALLAVVEPSGGEIFTVGDSLLIRWESSFEASRVTIDLNRYGQHMLSIATTTDDGEYQWVIPADFDAVTEDPDDYQVVVRAEYPDFNPGELYIEARSEAFTISPPEAGGLTDVTVTQRLITITVTDNGSQIDGDTVDIVLNGETVVASHVLVGPPGTDIPLTLAQGPNVLEIIALNEGAVSPNTAELTISNVVEGEAVQEWRLATGEVGILTITAP